MENKNVVYDLKELVDRLIGLSDVEVYDLFKEEPELHAQYETLIDLVIKSQANFGVGEIVVVDEEE